MGTSKELAQVPLQFKFLEDEAGHPFSDVAVVSVCLHSTEVCHSPGTNFYASDSDQYLVRSRDA